MKSALRSLGPLEFEWPGWFGKAKGIRLTKRSLLDPKGIQHVFMLGGATLYGTLKDIDAQGRQSVVATMSVTKKERGR